MKFCQADYGDLPGSFGPGFAIKLDRRTNQDLGFVTHQSTFSLLLRSARNMRVFIRRAQ